MSRVNAFAFVPLLFIALFAGSAVQTCAIPVTGTLNFTGSLTFSSTNLVFLPLPGPFPADFMIGLGNTGSFGPLTLTTGLIADIPSSPGIAQPTFLTFAANPVLTFNLLGVSPGVFGSAECGAPAAASQTCTPAGSIFNFSNTTATSSSVSFTVQGTMQNFGELTPYTGVFSMQFTDISYQQLLAFLNSGAFATASYSAIFVPTSTPPQIPEPATMLLLGTGLAGVTALIRKNRIRKKRGVL